MSQINKYTNRFLSEWKRKTEVCVCCVTIKKNCYANIIYFKMTKKIIKKRQANKRQKSHIFSFKKMWRFLQICFDTRGRRDRSFNGHVASQVREWIDRSYIRSMFHRQVVTPINTPRDEKRVTRRRLNISHANWQFSSSASSYTVIFSRIQRNIFTK